MDADLKNSSLQKFRLDRRVQVHVEDEVKVQVGYRAYVSTYMVSAAEHPYEQSETLI